MRRAYRWCEPLRRRGRLSDGAERPRVLGVRSLSVLCSLFAVVALLMLGAGGAWASASQPMACHETGGAAATSHAPAGSPVKAPVKPAMIMGCCVACVTPALPAAPVRVSARHERPGASSLIALPNGRSPSPEPGPPKPAV